MEWNLGYRENMGRVLRDRGNLNPAGSALTNPFRFKISRKGLRFALKQRFRARSALEIV